MSYEVANAVESLGQFASNAGYSALIAASQDDPVLKSFFEEGITEDVPAAVKALRALEGKDDVTETAQGLADLIDGEDVAVITDGMTGEEAEVEKQLSDDEDDDEDDEDEGEDEDDVIKTRSAAPRYRETVGDKMCKTCVHGGDGYCDLYKFNTAVNFVCDAHEPLSISREKYVPPQEVQINARKAQEQYRVAEEKLADEEVLLLLSALANGRPLSRDEIRFMADYLTEHYDVADLTSWSGHGAEWQAWNALGGRAGLSWAKRVLALEDQPVGKSSVEDLFLEFGKMAVGQPRVPAGSTRGGEFAGGHIGQGMGEKILSSQEIIGVLQLNENGKRSEVKAHGNRVQKDFDALADAQNPQLSWGQWKAVEHYTSGGDREINPFLRGNFDPSLSRISAGEREAFFLTLKSSVENSILPKDVVLYRGGMFQETKQFKSGAAFSDKGFSSHSPDVHIAAGFSGGLATAAERGGATAVIFQIPFSKGSKGLVIPSKRSSIPSEREVIIPPGNRFKIKSVEKVASPVFTGLVVVLGKV